jgi:ureidoglycolate lyase
MIIAEPLTAAAFAPFGQVIERPAEFGRIYFSEALASVRANAKPSLSLSLARPLTTPELLAVKMERHEFSSQSFVPLDVSRYLIVVAPHDAGGLVDHTRLQAFVARGDQGVTYGMNVWHHPLCVLDRPGRFAVFMWLDGGGGDEEFVDLPSPQTITFDSLKVS